MSQKVIQFPGARTAAGDHSGIVLRIGPRRYRLDILHPATGRDEPEDEVRPLPAPPRCRGIPVGDGTYTGCAYGRRRPRAPDWAVRLPYLPGLRHRKETTGDPAPVQYPKSFAPTYHPYPVKPPFEHWASQKKWGSTEIHQIVWPQMEVNAQACTIPF